MTIRNNTLILTPPKALDDRTTPETASAAVANIKFIGRPVYDRTRRKVSQPARPIVSISVGGRIIELPPADFQISTRLFYHEAAAEIARLFPRSYKLLKSFGSKK